MTQAELKTLVYRLRCCSSTLAYNLATRMINGERGCSISNLVILNDAIDILLKYIIDGNNCITEDDFDILVINAKNACEICDCD